MEYQSPQSPSKLSLEGNRSSDEINKASSSSEPKGFGGKAWAKLSEGTSLEGHGVVPLTVEERTDSRFFQNFTLWLTMNATIACFSAGTLGPYLFGLSLRDSALIIVFFNLFSCSVPSYFATFGPRLGMRTMSVARYSFGYYGAILPSTLNLIEFIGFCSVNAIVGGQTLAAVNPGNLSVTVGIVLIAVVSMVVSFLGYRVLHALERWAWIPVIFSFIMLCAFGGRRLGSANAFVNIPATASTVLSFASIIVGFSISWCSCSADFNTYMRADVSSAKVFFYTFAGLYLPSMLFQVMGAAFAAAALSGQVVTWEEAFLTNSVGGLVGVALEPLNGFAKVLLIIIALGMITNNAPTTYAFSLSIQIVFPFLGRLPRWIFPIVATAIYLPIAIVGASEFATVLNNFLGLLSYYGCIFGTIVLVEHFYFRKSRYAAYDVSMWNVASLLPPGIAALFAFGCGVAMAVLGMDQVWWRGPIARKVAGPDETHGGDVGFELAMTVAAIVYLGARTVEKKVFGR